MVIRVCNLPALRMLRLDDGKREGYLDYRMSSRFR